MQSAIFALYNNSGLLEKCNTPELYVKVYEFYSAFEETAPSNLFCLWSHRTKFFPALLHFYCYKAKLIDVTFIMSLDSGILNEFPRELSRESLTNDAELEVFYWKCTCRTTNAFQSLIEHRLFMDLNGDDMSDFLNRLVNDYTCHALFSEFILRVCFLSYIWVLVLKINMLLEILESDSDFWRWWSKSSM